MRDSPGFRRSRLALVRPARSGSTADRLYSQLMARRHESLIPLSHEHHDALLLAWRLCTGDLSKREPELRARHVSAFFEYRLVNHLKLEEDVVFPAFRTVLGLEASLIDVLLSDITR